jgi:hypothetical protein
MNIEKNINGYWILYETVDFQLISRTYCGYTKKEAIRLFKKYIKELTK